MTNPFTFNVADIVRGAQADGMPQQRVQVGPAPVRIGAEMIAVAQGAEVEVNATLTPLGGAVMVDAHVTGPLTGECVRCLAPLHSQLDLDICQVYANDPDFISGDPADEEDEGSGDELALIENDELDITQAVIDEAGLSLPFNPVCEDGCEINAPQGVETGVSGEESDTTDIRWSGLEKFL